MALVLFQWLAHNKGFSILKIGMDHVRRCSPAVSTRDARCIASARVRGDRGAASALVRLPRQGTWDEDVLLSAEKRQCIYAFRLFIFQSRKKREENRLRLRNERGKKGISKVLWRKKEQPPPASARVLSEQPKCCCDFRAPGLRAGRRRRSRTGACPVLLRCVHGTVRAAVLLIRLERGASLLSVPPLCSSLCPLPRGFGFASLCSPLGWAAGRGTPGHGRPPTGLPAGRLTLLSPGSPCWESGRELLHKQLGRKNQ